MKTLNAVVLAAALFLTATAAAAHPAPTPAPARTTPAFSHGTEAAAPEQGRRRRPVRRNPRREQPAETGPARITLAPAQTTPAPAQTPAQPLGLCNPDWHKEERGSSAVTRAVANGADVN